MLSLPICNNKSISYIDSIFMATSSVCVTGFSTITVSGQFNFLGQLILLILMQVGALGFMIFIAFILILRHKKISLSDTMLLGNTINSEDYSKIKEKVTQILKYAFSLEFLGAVIMTIRFIPTLGLIKGIWYGIFHSVSAFCNCGLDLFGDSSISYFRSDIIINYTFIFLIITGGIGFFVLHDIVSRLGQRNLKKINFQSKLVLSSTVIVLLVTTIMIFLFEKSISLLDALFASVTLRTAGFYTISFNEFSLPTKIISLVAMFIGGAPGSTSGGIKIVAFSIIILTTISVLKNKNDVIIFDRKITESLIKRSITIVIISLFIIFTGIILLVIFNNFGLINITFHTISAFSAVGLTLFDCTFLNSIGKIITIFIMFIGRIGPLSLAGLFIINKKENKNISFANGELII